jgi:hypothetical protein
MISGDNDYPEWALDVEALDMAIAALRPVSREQKEERPLPEREENI